MKASDLPKHVRDQLKPKPIAGSVWFRLLGDPPTVTHHDKKIGMRFGKGGKKHATLRDTPELEAARNWFIERIPFSEKCVAPPIIFTAMWFFPSTAENAGKPMITKPDLDNIEKVLLDVLALRGWIEHDQHVFMHHTQKWHAIHPELAGVALHLATLRVERVPVWPSHLSINPQAKLVPHPAKEI